MIFESLGYGIISWMTGTYLKIGRLPRTIRTHKISKISKIIECSRIILPLRIIGTRIKIQLSQGFQNYANTVNKKNTHCLALQAICQILGHRNITDSNILSALEVIHSGLGRVRIGIYFSNALSKNLSFQLLRSYNFSLLTEIPYFS